MELNISHTNSFQFENKENLRNTAKNILNKNGSSKEATEKIIEETIFNSSNHLNSYLNSQLNIAKASTQINLSETLKYLKKNINKKSTQKAKFGSLWEILSSSEENEDMDEVLSSITIDENARNIFAA